ncbi:MAG: isopropylmalate isomerase [Erythrobacter sp.]|uniref:isopropylmalate isomerase n=1 Tax=Erythrobacter sp. TaxID=1042 RepID=UPI00261513CF|nr:isopropylmalate isomerase [Erythrobacter sp.]MDJ0978622.1 isopropylmalate isomerase [Erythrobacter sp.]
MTDKTPDPEDKKTSAVAVGAAAIGSAAIAAALLYAGRRFRKKPEDSAIGAEQVKTPPSGEPPETD